MIKGVYNKREMIIRSRSNTFGFRLTIIATVAGICTSLYFFFFGFDTTTWTSEKIAVYSALIILVGTYGRLLYDANLIAIDSDINTITFLNRITRAKATYSFSDLDGKMVCYEPIKGGYVRNLYLIKNKRAIKKVTSFIYSNQNELEQALEEITDLGTFKYSYKKSWKISLGLPILD